MNKIAFVFSNLLTLFGLISLVLRNLIQQLLPKIGFMIFKVSAPSSYTPTSYQVDLQVMNIIGILSLVFGIVLSIFFYLKEQKIVK